MGIDIRRESTLTLSEYARIPIAFEVREIFQVVPERNDQFTLVSRRLPRMYMKDYDAIGERPVEWQARFDVSNWAFFSAFADGDRIGGATVAYKTPTLDMLEGRVDLAVLWDIRVDPANRRRGVGTALFDAATIWAMSNGCRQLKVETQNTNVAACRFYARHGSSSGSFGTASTRNCRTRFSSFGTKIFKMARPTEK